MQAQAMPAAATPPKPPVSESPEVPIVELNRFSLTIPEASTHTSSPQYAALSEGSSFSLKLGNENRAECDCEVFLDGVLMGRYRVPGNKSVCVDRPTALAQKFTFSSTGSVRRFDQHLPVDPAQHGLLKVVFKPSSGIANSTMIPPQLSAPPVPQTAQKPAHPFDIASTAQNSTQQFTYVPPLTSVDANATTTLFMRLVGGAAKPCPVPLGGSIADPVPNLEEIICD